MGDVNFTSFFSLLIFIMFYLCNKEYWKFKNCTKALSDLWNVHSIKTPQHQSVIQSDMQKYLLFWKMQNFSPVRSWLLQPSQRANLPLQLTPATPKPWRFPRTDVEKKPKCSDQVPSGAQLAFPASSSPSPHVSATRNSCSPWVSPQAPASKFSPRLCHPPLTCFLPESLPKQATTPTPSNIQTHSLKIGSPETLVMEGKLWNSPQTPLLPSI